MYVCMQTAPQGLADSLSLSLSLTLSLSLFYCTSARPLCRFRSGVCVSGWVGVPRQELELATASHKTLISQQLYNRVLHGLPITLFLAPALGVQAGALQTLSLCDARVAFFGVNRHAGPVQQSISFSFSCCPQLSEPVPSLSRGWTQTLCGD